MDLNKIWVISSAIIALGLYYPLLSGIVRGTIRQSFATWILWVALDAIAMVSIILQHGNFVLLICYVFGGTIVVISLVYTGQFTWTRFETFVLFLVIACLVVWYASGSKVATIASTLAVAISGAPQARDSWRKPDHVTGWIYSGYVLANLLSAMGGKNWSIEERFYPGCMVLLCATIACAAFRPTTKTVTR